MSNRPFDFLRFNPRDAKPRKKGITEIRGSYYTPVGTRYLSDVLETMGQYVDTLKFGGGSFVLYPEAQLKALIDLCHQHKLDVCTGGFMETVLPQGPEKVEQYINKCKALGFDMMELSSGFITIPTDDWIRLINKVKQSGMKVKAEVGIQFGAGGASTSEALESLGTADAGWMLQKARKLLEAGADMIMIESEGITESVKAWRTDVPAQVIDVLGLEKVMFEAADPAVFAWYVRNYGPEVNLFVDHSQIVQLECLREGVWGTSELWGRVHTYKG